MAIDFGTCELCDEDVKETQNFTYSENKIVHSKCIKLIKKLNKLIENAQRVRKKKRGE